MKKTPAPKKSRPPLKSIWVVATKSDYSNYQSYSIYSTKPEWKTVESVEESKDIYYSGTVITTITKKSSWVGKLIVAECSAAKKVFGNLPLNTAVMFDLKRVKE